MSLDRFKTAQSNPASGFATALGEIKSGRKTSHWIWYVFPQLASLGRSETAKFYGIVDLDEARAYLADDLLRSRLMQITEAARDQLAAGVPLLTLLGSTTDCGKIASSLTLFRAAATHAPSADLTRFVALCDDVLARCAATGYPPCAPTLAEIGQP